MALQGSSTKHLRKIKPIFYEVIQRKEKKETCPNSLIRPIYSIPKQDKDSGKMGRGWEELQVTLTHEGRFKILF